ncbi:hypothetical protein H8356DRAFT_1348301 [Neocallimastix lanati (nom. inval.)]|nr:hypothetical protein H8356DRAFT_1348301 [Neocallimastix sp. JGI-2020a]
MQRTSPPDYKIFDLKGIKLLSTLALLACLTAFSALTLLINYDLGWYSIKIAIPTVVDSENTIRQANAIEEEDHNFFQIVNSNLERNKNSFKHKPYNLEVRGIRSTYINDNFQEFDLIEYIWY